MTVPLLPLLRVFVSSFHKTDKRGASAASVTSQVPKKFKQDTKIQVLEQLAALFKKKSKEAEKEDRHVN